MPHSTPEQHSTQAQAADQSQQQPAAPSGDMKSAAMSNSLSAEPPHAQSLAPPLNPVVAHALQSITNSQVDSHSISTASDASNSHPSSGHSSPHLHPMVQPSGTSTPRTRKPPTTLNVPGMTSSKVSPDGRIADRDVASKLVIIMVGLPARGKSYITKKIIRYLKWQQHNAEIFNVGNRRRLAAGSQPPKPAQMDSHTRAAHILLNGVDPSEQDGYLLGEPAVQDKEEDHAAAPEKMEQDAEFFNPQNEEASRIREQVALSTLEEALDYLLHKGGSVAILDATNSTLDRRKLLYKRIKETEPQLGIVFIESVCKDEKILEANMWLKLSGPDYKGKDRQSSFDDFKKRVKAYETAYVPVGPYEEENDLPYIQMIDVGRKIVSFQCKSFLTSNLAHYLNTFNLAPRQIWITRHGQSVDNVAHRLGGDSDLTPEGIEYGRILKEFITRKKDEWIVDQKSKVLKASFPPKAGDETPPYPEIGLGELDEKNFCVWTSTLKRSIQTAKAFYEDEDYDCKTWKDLDEINAGNFEGSTYERMQQEHPDEYEKRAKDKLHYKYPGIGGEGYLQVIARLRDMVREIERIKDHVLIIGHRSICRVLIAYFMDIDRDQVADLNVPLGDLFVMEPKPYGVEYHVYRFNKDTKWFDEVLNWRPEKELIKGN